MTDLTNPSYLLSKQYNNAANLNARVQLHARFSTNTYGWFRWVFDQFNFLPGCRVLELGCGTGTLWLENLARIPDGWDVTLSDFSAGMVEQARQNLGSLRPFAFKQIDAQSIPYGAGEFDVVIANHMLYHVPDRPRALAEIRRVLKPGGDLYATTTGARHIQELLELPYRFDPTRAFDHMMSTTAFTLENGASQLQLYFPTVSLRRYPDALHVTEAAPLVDYIFSTFEFTGREDQRAALQVFIEREMQKSGGAIDVTKDSGMIIAF